MEHIVHQPPVAALKLLAVFVPGAERDPVEGDLMEEYQSHPNAMWFWGQVLRLLSHFIWTSMKRTPVRTVLSILGGYALLGVCAFVSIRTLQIPSFTWFGWPLIATYIVSGLLASMAGGYCAARVAGGRGAHGMIALCAFILVSWGLAPSPTDPWTRQFATMAVLISGVLVGGYLRARRFAI